MADTEARDLLEFMTNRVQQVRVHVRGGDDRYLTEDEVEIIKDGLYALYVNPSLKRQDN